MARSALTLAASATAALPGIGIVSTALLTEGAAGRFDAAVAELEDGRRVVIRTPAVEEASADLAAESRALHALTTGVREQLPFRAPQVIGESGSGMARVLVVEHLEGYRVDPAHLPKGPGIGPALGAALAAVHSLPPSVVRTDGLPVRTADQVRDEARRLLDRAEATRRVPVVLADRWRRAVDDDDLWRFEPAVILGGASSSSFLLDDDGVTARVVGVLDWSGLSVGDPATDLRWLASAPTAADAVFEAYSSAGTRAPDALLRERSRMYAELEFARWLVHGMENGDEAVVGDAVGLLDALAEGVRGERIVPDSPVDVDAALAAIENMPGASPVGDISMQTDAYDPAMMSPFLAAARDGGDEGATQPQPDFDLGGLRRETANATVPVDLSGWSDADEEPADLGLPGDPEDVDEAERASRAALRRWRVDGDDEARLSSGG